MIIDFDLIDIDHEGVVILGRCTLCGGVRRFELPASLGEIVEKMSEHLARNHGPEQSS